MLFNIRKFGAKIFTEGGLKRLLEARHPIKVTLLANLYIGRFLIINRADYKSAKNAKNENHIVHIGDLLIVEPPATHLDWVFPP